MHDGEVAALIVFIIAIVFGVVVTSYFYFRSREKQMMIEKGMSYEQMVEFANARKDPYTLLKVGIVILFFGLGLGIGVIVGEKGGNEDWIPLLMFTSTGIGFVAAYLAARKLKEADEEKAQNRKVGE